ncbi:hypothetical protein D3C78_298130 [compost metagenome]
MPTLDELKQYLASLGFEAPDFILSAWLEAVAGMADCLAEHYSPAVGKLIALYTLGLYAVAGGDRYVSSQSAPSGAARSFRFLSTAERWSGQLALLRQLDAHGCATSYTPADPTTGACAAYVGRAFR